MSNAIGRFGFCELVPELKRLLDEDLARLKRAIDAGPEALRRGDIRASSDAAHRYGNQYREALTRIGGEDVAAVAAQYLENPIFGLDAALILKALSDKQLNAPEPTFWRQWPWFDGVDVARRARAAAPPRAPANSFADPIFTAIGRLAKPENKNTEQLLAIELARVAMTMPHSGQDALITRVMALPQSIQAKRGLLAALALDGIVLDVTLVMQGTDEWLQQDPQSAWHRRQNTWDIEPWLELLPYTNQPASVIEGLAKVKEFYGTGWPKRWPRVLASVACLPGAEAEALLATLARTHKDIADEYEWMNAILGRDSSFRSAAVCRPRRRGVFGQAPSALDLWRAGHKLASYTAKFPHLERDIKQRYGSSTGPVRALLEGQFGQAGNEDDLAAMVEKYAVANQPYDGRMEAACHAIALRREPTKDGSSSFNIYPAPIARVRKYLFEVLGGTLPRAQLAKECLMATDVLRDEYGIAPEDSRHPNVLSESPWPLEAGSAANV